MLAAGSVVFLAGHRGHSLWASCDVNLNDVNGTWSPPELAFVVGEGVHDHVFLVTSQEVVGWMLGRVGIVTLTAPA